MKTIKTTLLTIATLLCSISARAYYDFEVDGIYYNITSSEDLTVEVTYKEEFLGEYINDYTGEITISKDVVYNGNTYSVTGIGDYAFVNCEGLTSITIPNSITRIGDYAINNCPKLTNITIPSSVTSIGFATFAYCSNLTSIIVDSENKFYDSRGNCNAIIETSSNTLILGCQSTIIPNSVTSIGIGGFAGSEGLTNIIIPESVTSIGDYAFSYCTGLTSITIPNLVTSIGSQAFYRCSELTNVTIGYSVASIGNEAFYRCDNLKNVINLSGLNISVGSTSYGYVAFYATKVTNNEIEADEYIDNYGFTKISDVYFLIDYIGDDTSLILPENCKGKNYVIGNSVFKDKTYINDITIPNSVTSIGMSMFEGCTNLKSITIPNSVTSIGESAFKGCSSLTDITIPNSVTSIGDYAFSDCKNLKTVINFSDITVTKGSNSNGCIGFYATKVINADEQVDDFFFSTSDDGIHSIIYYIENEESKELVLPDNYKGEKYQIESSAFSNCTNLTSVTIPNSVISIGMSAFEGCTGLKNITIPNSVTSIGESAFKGCASLTDITIPNSVTSIGDYAFYGCKNLKTIINFSDMTIKEGSSSNGYVGYYATKVVNADEQISDYYFTKIDNIYHLSDYMGNDTILILPENCKGENYVIGCSTFMSNDSLTNITIPNSVTGIAKNAFAGCIGLTNIIIPNSVTNIGNNAFNGCDKLDTVINFSNLTCHKGSMTNGGIAYYASKVINADEQIDNFYFLNNTLTGYIGTDKELVLPENYHGEKYTLGDSVFYDCDSTVKVIIPNIVTSIGRMTFSNNDNLAYINLGNTLNTIGYGAFADCPKLTNITIPNSVTSIENNAFHNSGLKELHIEDGNDVLSLGVDTYTHKYDDIHSYATDYGLFSKVPLEKLYLGRELKYETSGLHGMGLNRFIAPFMENTTLKDVVIGNSIKSIGMKMFYRCNNLSSIVIGSSVSSIGTDAFSACVNLTDITIDGSNTTYDSRKESNAIIETATNTLVMGTPKTVIPNSVTEIGDKAFYECVDLTNIEVPNSVTRIGKQAFYGCKNLVDIILGNSIINIEEEAFYVCSKLSGVVIPNSVITIGDYAFYGCYNLAQMAIGESVISIGENAFDGCNKLANVVIPNSVVTIGGEAFSGCYNLTHITIGNSVTSIGDDAFQNTKWWNDQPMGFVYQDNCLLGFKYNGSMPDNVNLEVNIEEGTRIIADNAFENYEIITNVDIPKSLTHIGKYAFYGCGRLSNIAISNSVEQIGMYAFHYCESLAFVHISDIDAWCGIIFENSYSNPLYYAHQLYLDSVEIIELGIPYSVESIGDYAFINCDSITSINIGNKVTNIGKEAFKGCTGVTQVICKASIPPTCGTQALDDINKWNCTLKVIEGSKAAYQVANQWKDFFFIEDVVSSIGNTILDAEATNAPIYNLQGVQMKESKEHLPAGIYIQGGKKMIIR